MDGFRNGGANGSRGSLRSRFEDRNGSGGGGGGSARSRVHFDDAADDRRPSSAWDDLVWVVTAFLAVVCMAGLFTITGILSFVVRPFSRSAYRRLAGQLGACNFLDGIALLLPDTKIYLTGDSDIPSPVGTSLLVSNHCMDADWFSILMLGRCVGLRGTLKFFLRNEYFHLNMSSTNTDASSSSSSSATASRSLSTNNAAAAAASKSNLALGRNGSGSWGTANGRSSPTSTTFGTHAASPIRELAIIAQLLHLFLEFPLVGQGREDTAADREQLYALLRAFADDHTAAPVHLLFFPEGWYQHNVADRQSILRKSNQFAARDGRPQLRHLLLPRTRGFNASLECLRHSSPIVYDVTVAYSGYDGSLPNSMKISFFTLWNLLRNYPQEVHIRIKRYSMEEVSQDANWLDRRWAEKDRLLGHFARHQSFPADNRGYARHRVFHTRSHSFETSIISLGRLLILPCLLPVLVVLSIPLFWTLLCVWIGTTIYRKIFPEAGDGGRTPGTGGGDSGAQTPGAESATGTPFVPATPFASPSISWLSMLNGRRNTGTPPTSLS